MEEGSKVQAPPPFHAEAAEQPPPVPMDQDEEREAAAEPMEDGEPADASEAADPIEDGEAAGDAAAAAEPMEDDAPTSSPTPSAPSATAAVDDSTIARKRRRRKKQFPGMIPTAGVRVLRGSSSSSAHTAAHLSGVPRRRGRPPTSSSLRLARELDSEALIALAAGFPADSLSEDEIAAGVLPRIGGTDQANYLVVRNHIIALWRSNPLSYIAANAALASIRAEHAPLVAAAHSFLSDHAYINFGFAPSVLSLPPRPPPSFPSPSVLIVGAGLAGLAAARHLISLGFKVAVIEGRLRPGGRVFTKTMRSSAAEYPDITAAADLGGSVLTGINGNPLGVIARQLGFPLHKVRDKCPLYLPDGRPVDPDMDARVEAAFNQLLDKVCQLRQVIADGVPHGVDVSLGMALEAFRAAHGVAAEPEERMLLDWHLANLEYANAAPLADLSMAFWDQDDPYEMGGDHCFIPGGNSQFVRALADGIPIFYGQNVRRIQYGCDGVMVHTDKQAFRGEMVLCTVPLGVLKRGDIKFVPELSAQKKESIQRLGFGLLNKVVMLFPYDFWDGRIDTFGHLTEDSGQRGEFFLFYSYSSVSGGPLLIALVAGESAVKFEKMSPMENVEKVLDTLRKIFSPKGIEVPNPLQVICTRWGTDRFTYGSYSYVAIGASGDDYDILAESVHNRVFFAGEATNRRYPATMHGALLSGYREAANILRAARMRARKVDSPEKMNVNSEVKMDVNGEVKMDVIGTVKMDVNGEVRGNVKDGKIDLDDLFRSPDATFGGFSVLHDPSTSEPDSMSLLRVGIGARKLGSGSLFLYGLIMRKNVVELAAIGGDEQRLSTMYRDFGTKLVGLDSLGDAGESLISRIKSAARK
ncbi:lysine-specific histone demethylase 1 homolog 1-like [Phragmites australis]|uniref:lysine-specific histone demethylase 1 homolog 1-like n=1 Tax=Phragmites australis TaxID=29695 RepID=UPI002D7A066D|nr:lysine-specific histone demethylase 1 homolog 1-like [Phragmites australis]